jgi:hypothetical protein
MGWTELLCITLMTDTRFSSDIIVHTIAAGSVADGSTALQVFELGGDVVPAAMAANLTRLIAEGSGNGDEEADNTMRSEVVASYLDLLQKPKLSNVLLTVCNSASY